MFWYHLLNRPSFDHTDQCHFYGISSFHIYWVTIWVFHPIGLSVCFSHRIMFIFLEDFGVRKIKSHLQSICIMMGLRILPQPSPFLLSHMLTIKTLLAFCFSYTHQAQEPGCHFWRSSLAPLCLLNKHTVSKNLGSCLQLSYW